MKEIASIMGLEYKDITKESILQYIPEEKIEIEYRFGITKFLNQLDDYTIKKIFETLEKYKDKIATLQEVENEIADKNKTEMKLEEIGLFMKKIIEDVENGDKEALKGYIELNRIEKGVKNYKDRIKDLALDDFSRWDKRTTYLGYSASVQNKINIKYETDQLYKEVKDELKTRENLLKTVVENNKKNLSTNDEDGLVIKCPDYGYSSSLVIKKNK